MRCFLLLVASLAVIKTLPRVLKRAASVGGEASARFDDLYSGAARRLGQTAEMISDHRAQRQFPGEPSGK